MNILAKEIFENLNQSSEYEFLSDGNESLSNLEFVKQVEDRAKYLSENGIEENSIITIENRVGLRFFVDLLAVWKLNACVCIFDKAAPEVEKEHYFELSQCSFVIENNNIIKRNDTKISFADMIIFTSGSTGLPKAVPLTANMLLANAKAVLKVHSLRPEDRLFANIPYRFMSNICHFLSIALTKSATFLGVEDNLMPKDFIDFMKENNVNSFGGAPIQANLIADAIKFNDLDKSQLRWFMSSGDHLTKNTIDKIFEYVDDNFNIVVAYGLTEVSGRLFINNINKSSVHKMGVGFPIECFEIDYEKFDDNFVTVNIKGDGVFKGYLNQDQSLNKSKLKDDFFQSGDYGQFDSDSGLTLFGRIDDVFKVTGLKVSIQLLCDTISALNSEVQDFTVVKYKDKLLGMIPCLIYKNEIERKDLLKLANKNVKPKLPSHYLIRKMFKVEDIPRTRSGKIERKKLAKIVEELQ